MKFFHVWILTVFLILLFVGGFFVWKNYFYQQEPMPPEEFCKDLCGDGICQEIVCLAIGCPCVEAPQICPQDCDETFGWRTYIDPVGEFQFKYPQVFQGVTWNAVNWPPRASVLLPGSDPIKEGCPDFEAGLAIASGTAVSANNVVFILYSSRGAAAGSAYTDYCYIAERNQKHYTLEFLIRTTNGCGEGCGPYCGTENEENCRNFYLVRDVETPIRKMVSTFKFLK